MAAVDRRILRAMAQMSGEGTLTIGGVTGSDSAVLRLQEEAKVLKTELASPTADLREVVPRIVGLLDEMVALAKAQGEEIRAQRFDGRMTTLLTHYLAALTALALAVAVVLACDTLGHPRFGLIVGAVLVVLAAVAHVLLVRRAKSASRVSGPVAGHRPGWRISGQTR